MLILGRKKGESILIGNNIHVKIIEIEGDKIKLAIDAPTNVSIIRNELVEAANENNEAITNVNHNTMKELKNILKNKNDAK